MNKEDIDTLIICMEEIKDARSSHQCIAAMAQALHILIDAEIERQEGENDSRTTGVV